MCVCHSCEKVFFFVTFVELLPTIAHGRLLASALGTIAMSAPKSNQIKSNTLFIEGKTN